MKFFFTQNSRDADAFTIKKQNITSTHLMERAATFAYHWIENAFQESKATFQVFCGVGNNGGDGLVLARLLKQKGYKVNVIIVALKEKYSADFIVNLERLNEVGVLTTTIAADTPINDFPELKPKDIIIDAVFGSGLSRMPEEWVIRLFKHINASNAYTIAVDIPSGLFLDKSISNREAVISADIVLTFQLPKLSFYLPETSDFVKDVVILDIGLDTEFIEKEPTNHYLIDKKEILKRYKRIDKFTHKGIQGHTLIIGGSYGKMGAPVLSSRAALKAGCGLVTAYIPKCGYDIVQTSTVETMVITDENATHISSINYDINPQAIAIGMGLGKHKDTQTAFHTFLKNTTTPLLIDADGLNILAENKEWFSLLPKDTILTPHPKELERLIGVWENDFDKIDKIREFAKKYEIIVVVKGAYTLITDKENMYVNSSGNQALATAGSGDVLSGIISGLLAQSYKAVDAAILGVYLHGLTADVAVSDIGYEAFVASDSIKAIGKAFLSLSE